MIFNIIGGGKKYDSYTVTVASNDTSKGTVSGTTTFQYITSSTAQTIDLSAVQKNPASGCKFENYTSSVGSIVDDVLTIPADTTGNITVTANFVEDVVAGYITFSSPLYFTLTSGTGSPTWDGTVEYSQNTTDWNTWNGELIESGSDNKLYLRGTGNTCFFEAEAVGQFLLSGNNISCSGNIMSLLNSSNPATATMGQTCFAYLFYECTALVSVSEDFLPATTLSTDCYYSMFRSCDNLATAPILPATTLAPECYANMFRDCVTLISVPSNMLPATELAERCYTSMFNGCSSLTTAPNLPATTLAVRCYQTMFEDCESLVVSKDSGAVKFFDCPDTSPNRCVYDMFDGSGGTQSDPVQGSSYYYN